MARLTSAEITILTDLQTLVNSTLAKMQEIENFQKHVPRLDTIPSKNHLILYSNRLNQEVEAAEAVSLD